MRRMSITKSHISNVSYGFTLAELIIVMTVSGILATMLFGPLNDLYYDNTKSLKSVIQVADTRGALRSIERRIMLSHDFTNTLTDHTGTTWNWTGTTVGGSTYRVLITSNYATDPDESSDPTGSRNLLYACSDPTPLLNYSIYFVSNGTLYRRTMQSTTAPCAGTIGQKQTCPMVNGTTCQAADAVILKNVTNFTVNYYSDAHNTTPLDNLGTQQTQYTDPTTPANARTVVISVTARSGTGGADTTTSSSLRITRINGT